MKSINLFVVLVIACTAVICIVEIESKPHTSDIIVSEDIKVRAKRETSSNVNLIELAIKYGAPFAKVCLERLGGDIFGSGRASRSIDVVIFNQSGIKFKCASSKCDRGCYTSSLLPELEIVSKQSSVFGMESTGFFGGVQCTTKYESDDGKFFEIKTRNPFFGSNSASESNSPNLVLTHKLGSGNNNQVRWIVDNKKDAIPSNSDSNSTSASDSISNFDINVRSTFDYNINSDSNVNSNANVTYDFINNSDSNYNVTSDSNISSDFNVNSDANFNSFSSNVTFDSNVNSDSNVSSDFNVKSQELHNSV